MPKTAAKISIDATNGTSRRRPLLAHEYDQIGDLRENMGELRSDVRSIHTTLNKLVASSDKRYDEQDERLDRIERSQAEQAGAKASSKRWNTGIITLTSGSLAALVAIWELVIKR